MNSDDFQILLYYKYVHIDDPAALVAAQRQLCEQLGLRGRILIAHEGINGTVEGTRAATEAYAVELMRNERFSDIDIKRSPGTGAAFQKLFVRERDEIVGTHFPAAIDPTKKSAAYISAEELHDWIHGGKKIFIVDMRNDYEHVVGHFKNSILPSIKNARDLPDVLPELMHLKNETVVTVCTGGVRCEKMSALLLHHDFTDVYQLHGGIVTYMEKFPNEDFAGKLYVFDGRIMMGFNTNAPEHEVIANCALCGVKSDNYINCGDAPCHKQFICCNSCVALGQSTCPAGCVIVEKSHNH